jgi:hypothetical protein
MSWAFYFLKFYPQFYYSFQQQIQKNNNYKALQDCRIRAICSMSYT